MPIMYGSYPIPGTETPEEAGTTGLLTIRELRNLYPHMTRRELRAQYPEAPTPGSGMPGGVTRNQIRNSIPDSTQYFSQINPQYTQAQPFDSFAPMRMYQQFQQTGQLPGMSSPAPNATAAGGNTGSGYTTGGK